MTLPSQCNKLFDKLLISIPKLKLDTSLANYKPETHQGLTARGRRDDYLRMRNFCYSRAVGSRVLQLSTKKSGATDEV